MECDYLNGICRSDNVRGREATGPRRFSENILIVRTKDMGKAS